MFWMLKFVPHGGMDVGAWEFGAFAGRRLRRDEPSLLQRLVGAVFIQRLHSARGYLDADEFLQLRHPNPALVQVRAEGAGYVLGDVTAHTALFLGHTTPMNHTSARDF